MISNTIHSDRLTQLKSLLEILAEAIDRKPGARDLAQLSKQYRETLREIEELEAAENIDDPISDLLSHWRSEKCVSMKASGE